MSEYENRKWTEHARPPAVHPDIYFYMMSQAEQLPPNIRVVAYYDGTTKSLVLGRVEGQRVVAWNSETTPTLIEEYAKDILDRQVCGEKISMDDVAYYNNADIPPSPNAIN